MTELLTAAQMRAIEQAAIASGQVTGLELMERAGRGVVEAIFAEWPELAAGTFRAVVLCGPGNNGGDGFVVARLLKEWGWAVEVFLYGEPARMPPDARVNYERWVGMGEVRGLRGAEMDAVQLIPDLVIDAIFGTGLSRPIPWDLADAVQHYAGTFLHGVKVVAIDVPSGLSSDTGCVASIEEGPENYRQWKKRAPGVVLEVTLCVTFHARKLGHILAEGPSLIGKLVCKSIGLPSDIARKTLARAYNKETRTKADYSALIRLIGDETLLPGFSFPESVLDKAWTGLDNHKYSHGHAVILSGPSGKGGAARLAARGALRIGAGVVTVGCPPDAIPENAARLDAIMLRGVADGAALAEVLQDKRINALCMGPGMGVSDETGALTAQGLKSGRAMVLDADALTLIARNAALFAGLHDGCILTPHAGEFARLFPDIAEKLAAPATKGPAYSKVDATREAATRAGCVVLFKGPDTVIADPSGRCAINSAHYDRAAPWLATAGSGDVLAGFITGLLARGIAPFDAACTAAWLHVECARSFGPGLIAEDLPEELPKVFRALGL